MPNTDNIRDAVRRRRAVKEQEALKPEVTPAWAQERPRKASKPRRSTSKAPAKTPSKSKVSQKAQKTSNPKKSKTQKDMPEKTKQKRKSSETTKKAAKKSRSRSAPAHAKSNPKLQPKAAKKSQKESNVSLNQIAAQMKNLKSMITDGNKSLTQSYQSLLKNMGPATKPQKAEKSAPQIQAPNNNVLLKALAEGIKSKAPVELRYQLVEWIRQHYGNKHANELMEDIGLPTPDRKGQNSAAAKFSVSGHKSKGARRSSYRLDSGSNLNKRAPSSGNKSEKGGRGRPKKLKSDARSGDSKGVQEVVDPKGDNQGKVEGENGCIEANGDLDGMGESKIMGPGDDMIPQCDNESEKFTMQMSVNNDGVKKPLGNFMSEAGSQN